jgi:hypothetical protein
MTLILWNPKVHYRVYNIPQLVHILSQTDPVNTFPPDLRPILVLCPHLCLGLTSNSVLQVSPP